MNPANEFDKIFAEGDKYKSEPKDVWCYEIIGKPRFIWAWSDYSLIECLGSNAGEMLWLMLDTLNVLKDGETLSVNIRVKLHSRKFLDDFNDMQINQMHSPLWLH